MTLLAIINHLRVNNRCHHWFIATFNVASDSRSRRKVTARLAKFTRSFQVFIVSTDMGREFSTNSMHGICVVQIWSTWPDGCSIKGNAEPKNAGFFKNSEPRNNTSATHILQDIAWIGVSKEQRMFPCRVGGLIGSSIGSPFQWGGLPLRTSWSDQRRFSSWFQHSQVINYRGPYSLVAWVALVAILQFNLVAFIRTK